MSSHWILTRAMKQRLLRALGWMLALGLAVPPAFGQEVRSSDIQEIAPYGISPSVSVAPSGAVAVGYRDDYFRPMVRFLDPEGAVIGDPAQLEPFAVGPGPIVSWASDEVLAASWSQLGIFAVFCPPVPDGTFRLFDPQGNPLQEGQEVASRWECNFISLASLGQGRMAALGGEGELRTFGADGLPEGPGLDLGIEGGERESLAANREGAVAVAHTELVGQNGSAEFRVVVQMAFRTGPAGSSRVFVVADSSSPTLVTRPEGDFLVLWQELGDQEGSEPDMPVALWGRLFNGEKAGPIFSVREEALGPMGYSPAPAVAVDRDGSFLAVWLEWPAGAQDARIYGRRFSPDGSPLGDRWILQGAGGGSLAFDAPVVARLSTGEYLLVWLHSDLRLLAQRFSFDEGTLPEPEG